MNVIVHREVFSDLLQTEDGQYVLIWYRPKSNPAFLAIVTLHTIVLVAYVPLILLLGLPAAIAILGVTTFASLFLTRRVPRQVRSQKSTSETLSPPDTVATLAINEAMLAFSRTQNLLLTSSPGGGN